MSDKHQALRDVAFESRALTPDAIIAILMKDSVFTASIDKLLSLLTDHDRMRKALERIVDDESCDYETIFRIADVVLQEIEQ